MIKGFREFIMRGNVVDLAVAVVIGAAFGAIVTSLNENILTPIIAAIFGKPDFSEVGHFTINGAHFYPGAVLTDVLNFLLIALAIYFLIVVPMNALAARRKSKDEPEEAAPTEIELLTEIRDALNKRG